MLRPTSLSSRLNNPIHRLSEHRNSRQCPQRGRMLFHVTFLSLRRWYEDEPNKVRRMYPVKSQHCSLSKRAQFVLMLIPNSGIKMEVCPDVLSLFKRIEPYYQAEPSDIRRLIQRRLEEAYDPIFRHNRKAKQVYFRSGIQRYFAHSKSDTIYSHQS